MTESATTRRRMTATPPADTPIPEAVRSRRRTVSASPEQANENSLATLALRIYNAKIAADQADADYQALRAEGLAMLQGQRKTEFVLPSEANRPAFEMKIAAKTTNTIDPEKFQKMVKAEEFIQCVSVRAADAKRFVGDARLESITTGSKSAPYLDCRLKGKARD